MVQSQYHICCSVYVSEFQTKFHCLSENFEMLFESNSDDVFLSYISLTLFKIEIDLPNTSYESPPKQRTFNYIVNTVGNKVSNFSNRVANQCSVSLFLVRNQVANWCEPRLKRLKT